MLKVSLVTNEFGDYEGLYIDDELVNEQHKIQAADAILYLAERFPISFEELELMEDELDILKWSLPSDIKEIKKAKRVITI